MAATAFVLSAAPLLATTRTVTNLNDTGPGSLRQLISESAANDTINFSVRGTITLTSGELLINKHLTISGPGANVLAVQRSTAGGTPQFRIFDIPSSYFNVTISGLRIANGIGADLGGGGIFNESSGTLAVTGCTISGNSASEGGGIYCDIYSGGTVTITNSTISGNTASSGGGIVSSGNINDGAATVTITDSTISGNTASSSFGGGIDNEFSTVNLVNSTISDNTASGSAGLGGGISNGGTVNLTNSTISGNTASGSGSSGGGIYNGFNDTVTVTNSTISGNAASDGGGIYNGGTMNLTSSTVSRNSASNSGGGGGILNTGTVNLTSSTISRNVAFAGGGIENGGGTVNLANSTISGNTASSSSSSSSGGGIDNGAVNGDGMVTVTNSTISGNTASAGGGISNGVTGGGTVTVTNSTISGNTASSSFGGFGGGFGGGISNGGTVNLTSSTISGNTASSRFGGSGFGGGISNGGTVNLTNSTISGNTASNSGGGITNQGVVNARNTITAKNTAPNGPDVGGALTSYGFNLIGNNSGSMITPTTGDQIGTPGSPIDPLLGQLADNGGPTKTQALLSGSPAINAGGPSAPARDQRGYVRQNAPDIGAFEFGALIPVTLANISARAFVQTGDNVMIGGFIVIGSGQKKVIVRAIGPSLVNHGITNPLQNPTLELHDHTGAVIASNDNWMNAPNKQAIIDSGLAPGNNLESAILTSLNPGAYTAIVRGVNNGTGIALVEGYDLDRSAGSKLGNISTRALVQTGNNVMIGGLIITGPDSDKVIVRAIGPSLTQHGITNALADPTLELHDQNGTLLAFNDNWKDTQQAEITATGLAPTNDKESAIVRTLAPGNYTAIVRGRNSTIGIALVEVYGLN